MSDAIEERRRRGVQTALARLGVSSEPSVCDRRARAEALAAALLVLRRAVDRGTLA